jgi:hypothetical protein
MKTRLILLIILGLLAYAVIAQSARYQLIRMDSRGWFWAWHHELPYIETGAICWDDATNSFCEAGFDLARATWIYAIIDTQNYRYGTIYQQGRRNARCFVLWWHNDYGVDGNPHIAALSWISCPSI